jgi:hypothetical protein
VFVLPVGPFIRQSPLRRIAHTLNEHMRQQLPIPSESEVHRKLSSIAASSQKSFAEINSGGCVLIDTARQGHRVHPQFFRTEFNLGGCNFSIASATNVSSGFCSLKTNWVVADLSGSTLSSGTALCVAAHFPAAPVRAFDPYRGLATRTLSALLSAGQELGSHLGGRFDSRPDQT